MSSRKLRLLVWPVALALLTGCGASGQQPLAAVSLQPQMVAPSADQSAVLASFGEQLFDQVLSQGEANPVISPLSVFYALGMVADGAGGDTATAFQQVLGLSSEQTRAVAAYLLGDLTAPGDGTTLTLANSAWLDQRLTPKQDWVDRLQAYYQADVFNTNLRASDAVPAVNGWINDKTNGLIPQMLNNIDDSTVALLANALYMKADWAQPFDTANTQQRVFTTAGGDVDAFYMTTEPGTWRCIDTDTAQGVVLPYADGRLVFLAAMPTNGQFELTGTMISSLLASAHDVDNVVVAMPKFHAEYGDELVKPLTNLGLGVAFSPNTADLSGIGTSSVGPLFIGSVQHKVSMAVGEEGTEAAAATVVAVATGAMITTLINFDHPYLYAIVDQVTGLPLFIGMMGDPSLAPPDVE